jgi:hypothetical protein
MEENKYWYVEKNLKLWFLTIEEKAAKGTRRKEANSTRGH